MSPHSRYRRHCRYWPASPHRWRCRSRSRQNRRCHCHCRPTQRRTGVNDTAPCCSFGGRVAGQARHCRCSPPRSYRSGGPAPRGLSINLIADSEIPFGVMVVVAVTVCSSVSAVSNVASFTISAPLSILAWVADRWRCRSRSRQYRAFRRHCCRRQSRPAQWSASIRCHFALTCTAREGPVSVVLPLLATLIS